MSKFTALQKRALVMWTVCARLSGKYTKCVHYLSTNTTVQVLKSLSTSGYPPRRSHVFSRLSTLQNRLFNRLAVQDFHQLHRDYNYNYLYIRKG